MLYLAYTCVPRRLKHFIEQQSRSTLILTVLSLHVLQFIKSCSVPLNYSREMLLYDGVGDDCLIVLLFYYFCEESIHLCCYGVIMNLSTNCLRHHSSLTLDYVWKYVVLLSFVSFRKNSWICVYTSFWLLVPELQPCFCEGLVILLRHRWRIKPCALKLHKGCDWSVAFKVLNVVYASCWWCWQSKGRVWMVAIKFSACIVVLEGWLVIYWQTAS